MSTKVSIITVVKNNEKFIKRTLLSVINQTYKNIEYIIIDGASTDCTLEKINKFKDKIYIIISEQDKGIYDAMNKGIRLATGNIIGICNSGDILKKNAIEKVVSFFLLNKKVDFLFGGVWRFYNGAKIKKKKFIPSRIYYNFDCFTSHSTGFYIKKESQDKLGFYNTKFQCSADYDLFYRMIVKMKMKGAALESEKIIGVVRSGGFSSKLTYLQHLKEETLIRIYNKQNLLIIIIIFLNSYIKNLIKIIKQSLNHK
jgi:glycosyltransferase involved in cell wall biosynthesis